MIKHQSYTSSLPIQVGEPQVNQLNSEVPISPVILTTGQNRQHTSNHLNQQLVRCASSKMAARRHVHHHNQNHHLYSHNYQHHHHNHLSQRPRVIRVSEYKNLRQVVPSLRRQRDVGKVEVVTEAARYIDHLHKTLIERFVLCGIPESLKDILGTDDANELNSQHIMNLVTKMAAKEQQQQQQRRRQQQHQAMPTVAATTSAPMRQSNGIAFNRTAGSLSRVARAARHQPAANVALSLIGPSHNSTAGGAASVVQAAVSLPAQLATSNRAPQTLRQVPTIARGTANNVSQACRRSLPTIVGRLKLATTLRGPEATTRKALDEDEAK